VLGLASLSFAQPVSVKTNPVGAVTKAIPVGLTSVGITLINPDLAVASCSANTASVITLTGISNVASLLTAGTPYYLEVISSPGAIEGDRFEVDTAATIAAANGTVVINTSSANNTIALTNNLAVGSQIALRKHITVAQVQSFFTTPLVGNNNSALADQIQILNPAGNGFVNYFLRGNLTEWRVSGTTTVATNFIIPPGVGIFVKKNTSPTSIVMTGGVRVNDFALPLPVGLSLRAHGYPISYSPSTLGGTAALGWTANNQAALSDQLQVLNSSGTGFTNYFLRGNGTEWRLSGTTTVVTTTEVLPFSDAFVVSRKQADASFVVLAPSSLSL
jgi:hypothetical protein